MTTSANTSIPATTASTTPTISNAVTTQDEKKESKIPNRDKPTYKIATKNQSTIPSDKNILPKPKEQKFYLDTNRQTFSVLGTIANKVKSQAKKTQIKATFFHAKNSAKDSPATPKTIIMVGKIALNNDVSVIEAAPTSGTPEVEGGAREQTIISAVGFQIGDDPRESQTAATIASSRASDSAVTTESTPTSAHS